MRTKTDYTLYKCYNIYKKESDNPVDYKTYKSFYKDLFDNFYDELVKGKRIQLPCNFGGMLIAKKRPSIYELEDGRVSTIAYRPDWKATKELWKTKYPGRELHELKEIKNKPIIFYKNEHTDGYRMYLFLDRKKAKVRGKSLLEISFVRTLNRKFNQQLKEEKLYDKYDYYEQ